MTAFSIVVSFRLQRAATLFLWLLLLALPAASAPVRLGIVTTDNRLREIADQLTVVLSSRDEVELLERDRIGAVLKEQRLNLGSGGDLVRLGALLSANGLLVLERRESSAGPRIAAKLVAAGPGVVLLDDVAPWPEKNAAEWCERLGRILEPLLPKLAVAKGEAIPVSVLNLRSALQSREARETERELTLLLIHRLAREPRVFVLERRHLATALFEKEITAEPEPFWTGRYLVDGTLDGDGFDPATLHVRLRLALPDGTGAKTIEVSGPRTNRIEMAETLTRRILAELDVVPGLRDWHATDEARGFKEEARWAVRWGQWNEAQAAGDSAWALGERTDEIAQLRIRAFGGPFGGILPHHSGNLNLVVEANPDANSLRPAERALGLFTEHVGSLETIPSGTNWFGLGANLLVSGFALLDGFYQTAELRTGNEAALAGLREQLRNILPVMDRLSTTNVRPHLEKVQQVKWLQGGLAFEHPEGALPLFEGMVHGGYAFKHLPRFAGWTWVERQTIPALHRRLAANLRRSTNAWSRLEGIHLALLREPTDLEGRFRVLEEEMAAALWERREEIIRDGARAGIVTRLLATLMDKHRYPIGSGFDRAPLAQALHGLRREFLVQSPTWNFEAYLGLFPSGRKNFSPGEAAELLPLAEALARRTEEAQAPARPRHLSSFVSMLRQEAGAAPLPSVPASAPPRMDALFPELAGGPPPWSLESSPWPFYSDFLAVRVRAGRIWALAIDTRSGGYFDPRSVCLAVDPATGKTETYELPAGTGHPDEHFEVTPEAVYVSVRNRLLEYSFAKRSWRRIDVPMEGGAQLLAVDGRLFLLTGDSLLQMDGATEVFTVVASARRRPAQNPFDEQPKWPGRLHLRDPGSLGVLAGRSVFGLDPETSTWTTHGHLEATEPGFLALPRFSDEALDLLIMGPDPRRKVVRMSPPGQKPTLLLRSGDFKREGQDAAVADETPRWDWPEPFALGYGCQLAEGDGLWVWQPTDIPNRYYGKDYRAVTYQDDRDATLLRFTPDQRRPYPLGVRFTSKGVAANPFTRDLVSMGRPREALDIMLDPMPDFLATPDGLVVVCLGNSPQHWFLPKAELAKRFDAVRLKLSRPGPAENRKDKTP